MMKGYLDTVNQNAIVTVAGLPTNSAGYDLYVYADGSNGTATRTGTYQISGAGITTTSINLTDAANTNFSGTFVQANNSNGNYVMFTINATGFTLTAIPGAASDGVMRAPVNGIQIVPHSTTPDFSISASPSSQTVTPGNSTTYTVTVGALNGFTGTVTLSASGLPTGATASFSPATLSGSGTSTLTVTTASTTAAGTSTLTITGTSGSLTHSTTTTLVVSAAPDFSISTSPSSQTVTPGNSTTYTVTVGALNGFTGTVTLSASGLPTGATASFSPATLSGSGTSTLTVTTASTTAAGTSTLTITGTSGSLTHSTTTTLVVITLGAISIDLVGASVAPMAASEVAGVVPKSNWNDASGANGSGLALVDETGAATGATVTWTASSVHSMAIADTAGNFRMMNGYLDTVNQNAIVTVAGLPTNSAGYDLYVYADGSNGTATRTGTYQISGAGITTTSINLTDAANTNFSGTFVQANNSNGNYVMFTINATGFTLTAIPSTASDGVMRAPVNGIQIVPH